ncbi:MAG: hypothetical protein ACJ79C_00510 [Myxococcales bacterium]
MPIGELPPEDVLARDVEERLRDLAGRFPPAVRERVNRLLFGAAQAILQLADIDLIRFETRPSGGSATLAVWEEVAPVMSETVESVNRLVAVAEEVFPPSAEPDLESGLDAAFGPASARRQPDRPRSREEEIAALVSAVSMGLRGDVARLGERLRNPSVVSDTWNLVSDLLEFRGRSRAGIGELIYQLVSTVAQVRRIDVVPGYATDLGHARLVRDAATNLAFLFRGHARRIASTPDDRLGTVLAEALRDIQAFTRTRALAALRTADKRIFLETRERLLALSLETPLRAKDVKLTAENLARFLDSLSLVSRRENLRLHDSEQLAEARAALEIAQQSTEPSAIREGLMRAVSCASRLYGRDAQLDAFLRSQRHFPAEWLSDAETPEEVNKVGGLLAAVPPP